MGPTHQGSDYSETTSPREQPDFSIPFSLRAPQGLLHASLLFVSPSQGAGAFHIPEDGLDTLQDALEGV